MPETIKKSNITSFGLILIIAFSRLILFFPSLGSSNDDKAPPQILARDDVFFLMSSGVVIDKKRKLMWACTDNGTRPATYPSIPSIQKVSGGSMWHHKSNTIGNRILPVRNME